MSNNPLKECLRGSSMSKIMHEENNTIFALDIGTRSVIGMVATFQEGHVKILGQHMVEHQSRAMLDGQIHDIPRVAQAVQQVKGALEKKLKQQYTKVAIAAAGRSLQTRRCRVDQDLAGELEIDTIVIHTLEMLGVQRAQEVLESEACGGAGENYFCVGHSVVGYYLNDYPIGNLEGHRAKKIGAEVLATFLPSSVVNSLRAVLARVNLEPLNLTLEPIAACEAVIPEQLRLLNLALVDVGAGTSDIAIAKEGTIAAYGMVPTAGDEITEILMEALMVDFMTAEKIKRSLPKNKDIVYQDALGLEAKITCAEILQIIEPAVESLAQEIADHILELNGQVAPKSVLCVGGGAQVPTLAERLASKLGLIPQRVALRSRSNISQLTDCKKKDLAGPEGVTVVGIAMVAAKRAGQNFISVTVNGQPFTLFHTRQMTVLQALGFLNFNPRELLGLNGKDLHFTLNGLPKTVYGEMGKPAVIRVNGQPAHLRTVIKNGDVIWVEKAVNGQSAQARVEDFGPESSPGEAILYLLNGQAVEREQPISPGDQLLITQSGQKEPQVVPSQQSLPKQQGVSIQVQVNGQSILMEGKSEYILIDVFNYYELDLVQSGGLVEIKRNGTTAEYTEVLQDGDEIEICW